MPDWVLPGLKEGGLIAVIVVLLLVIWGLWYLLKSSDQERKDAHTELLRIQQKSLEAGHAMARAVESNTKIIEQVLGK